MRFPQQAFTKKLQSCVRFCEAGLCITKQEMRAIGFAGVALGYSQLTDNDIINLPIPKLQSNGFLFVWVINAKYTFTLDLFERWGYT